MLHKTFIGQDSLDTFESICASLEEHECLVINNWAWNDRELKYYTAGDKEAKRRTKHRLCSYEEELMRVTWHPKRLEHCGEEIEW